MTTMPVLKETTSVVAKGYTPASKPPAPPADAGGVPPSGLPGDLAVLTDDQLAALLVSAQREIDVRTERKREALLASLRQQAEAAEVLGIPLARLRAAIERKSAPKSRQGSGTDGRSVVAAKYRDPADPSRIWSGRGEPPAWIKFGTETLPPRKPGGEPRKVPLPQFLISEQEK